jgi:hypothetical protein
MTIGQSNRERMGSTTLNVLNEGADVYAGSDQFKGYVDLHEGNLNSVRNWINKQAEAIMIKGMTQDKNALRLLMVGDLTVIIGAVKSLATDTKNNTLYESVNYSDSRLLQKKESIFIADSTQVISVATANQTALLPYGITSTMLTNTAADILTFQGMKTQGNTKKSNIKVYTLNLKTSVKTMMTHLKQAVDNSIKQWKSVAPDWVNAYKAARKIINYAAPETGAHGKVSDSSTTQLLKGVVVEIVELNRLTSTNERGVFVFKRLEEGTYTIRFRKSGYIIAEMPIKLVKDRFTQFNMTIEHQPVRVPS